MAAQYRILAVDDNEDSLFALEQLLVEQGFDVSVAVSGREALERIGSDNPDIVLLDINMPGMDGHEVLSRIKSDEVFQYIPVIILTANESEEDVHRGFEGGADDYVRKPFRTGELIDRVNVALKRTRPLYGELRSTQESNAALRRRLGEQSSFGNILGRSTAMKSVFDLIQKVVDAPVPVLVTGESGTGKELVARAIHFNSMRKQKTFIAQNCAAFSESLLESELFGHVRGAFTGAIRDREGLFQAADGGTLFLDEVGEMALPLQAKLLRVLQDGSFSQVGENKLRRADVRVVAATNRNLHEMVQQGKFREDLYYRLNVVSISIPPLRERRVDIRLLADFFLEEIGKRSKKTAKRLSSEAFQLLSDYDWPGNVRQLQNEMERAWILSTDSDEIQPSVLSPEVRRGSMFNGSPATSSMSGEQVQLKDAIQELERKMIKEALERLDGNKSEAARELGMSRSNLIAKVKEYGLD